MLLDGIILVKTRTSRLGAIKYNRPFHLYQQVIPTYYHDGHAKAAGDTLARRPRAPDLPRKARELRPRVHPAPRRPHHARHRLPARRVQLEIQLPARVRPGGREHRPVQLHRRGPVQGGQSWATRGRPRRPDARPRAGAVRLQVRQDTPSAHVHRRRHRLCRVRRDTALRAKDRAAVEGQLGVTGGRLHARGHAAHIRPPLSDHQGRLARFLPRKLGAFEPRFHLPDGRVQGSPPRTRDGEPCDTGSAAATHNLGTREYVKRWKRRLRTIRINAQEAYRCR